ncbi:hypothetical protein P22_3493 [Propionispora sp. 2/2-37]|uniref:hypothetical protein n=1 Tax=Propionispora sp. 2/2-37 TaxID=1677858 RepID=UPI0006BB586E|nr:hypothetical protein [Propionispora sp. 2/2-37]CUH97365.1 hypothetical protein P22_3493 [Propionispora sp. 2/2-37]
MTAKVVTFPTQTEQLAEEMDRMIRIYLFELTGNKDLVRHVGDRMKDFISKYATKTFEPCFHLAVPAGMPQQQIDRLLASVDEGFQKNALEVQEMINKIIFERLYLEIELYDNMRKHKTAAAKQNNTGLLQCMPSPPAPSQYS